MTKRKKLSQRILAGILALAMMAGIVPVTAFAVTQNNVTYTVNTGSLLSTNSIPNNATLQTASSLGEIDIYAGETNKNEIDSSVKTLVGSRYEYINATNFKVASSGAVTLEATSTQKLLSVTNIEIKAEARDGVNYIQVYFTGDAAGIPDNESFGSVVIYLTYYYSTDNGSTWNKQVLQTKVDVYPAQVTEYTLTVENGTGDGSYEAGEAATITADAKDGYTFSSWTQSGTAGTFGSTTSASTIFTMGAGNATVTANYTQNKYDYSLSYDANLPTGVSGNVSVPKTQTQNNSTATSYSFSVDTNRLTEPSGYTFLGWSTGENATSATYAVGASGQSITLASTSPSETLYAVWAVDTNNNDVPDANETYTVTYSVDSTTFASEDYLQGTQVTVTSSVPGKALNVFAGWLYNDTTYWAGDNTITMPSSNITLVAQWKEDLNSNETPDEEETKYTVTYTDGVDDDELFADQTTTKILSGTTTPAFDYGATDVEVTTDGELAREGYVFAGWKDGVAETVTADATYTATWKVDANKDGIADENQWKVTLDYTQGATTTAYVTKGDKYTLPSEAGGKAPDGYTLIAWKDAAGDEYALGAEVEIAADTQFTAVYVTELTVEVSGGDKGAETVDGTLTLDIDIDGGKASYTVTSVNKDGDNGTVQHDAETGEYTLEVTKAGEYTVTVEDSRGTKTSVTFTIVEVTFDSQGGTDVPSQLLRLRDTAYTVTGETTNPLEVTVTFTPTETLPLATEPADPTQEGYVFTGWYTDETCTELYTFGTKVENSFTLYAGWAADTNGNDVADKDETKYTVTWKNDDVAGTTLETDTNVLSGTAPSYDGATPTKEKDAQYTYTFAGWTSDDGVTVLAEEELPEVTGDVTYTASYTESINSYEITFVYKAADGTEKTEKATYDYDATVTVPEYPETVVTTETTYTFTGWDSAVVAVAGTAIYTAEYNEAATKYEITFVYKAADGTEKTEKTTYEYGATVTAPEYPTTVETLEKTYTFTGWDSAVVAVAGTAIYTAEYNEAATKYEITFVYKAADGSEVEDKTTYEYGATVTEPNYPATVETLETTYTFTGWDSAVVAVAGTATYTAEYEDAATKYEITFVYKAADGSEVEDKTTYEYGATVTEPNYPATVETLETTYTFTGWDSAVVAVAGTATYTAEYEDAATEYEITFYDEDGETILGTEAVAYGEVPTLEDPTKDADSENTYEFAGWEDEEGNLYATAGDLPDVIGAASYTATYEATAIVVEDDTEDDTTDTTDDDDDDDSSSSGSSSSSSSSSATVTTVDVVDTTVEEAVATTAATTTTTTTTTADDEEDDAEEAAAAEPATEIEADEVPLAAEEAATEIAEEEVPLVATASAGSWALMNLFLAIATAATSIVMLAGYFLNRRDEEEGDGKGSVSRLLSLLPALLGVVCFALTQNMANPMAFVDKWTLAMVLIALIQVAVVIKVRKDEGEQEDSTFA